MEKLEIIDLHASVGGIQILRGVNLEIRRGESLALLGPNGHGKSTLLGLIMGNPRFHLDSGKIVLDGEDISALSPDERSKRGLFLAMQNPSEIPGLNSADFLKAMMNAHREKKMSLLEFYRSMNVAYEKMGIPFEMSKRNLNEGFSGGEKKRNEILQMLLLNPSFAMLDEIDSGLDVDAINVVAKAINEEAAKGTSFLIVSHYARLYNLLKPTRAAIMVNGRIAVDGDPTLIERVDHEGYEWIKRELGIEIEKEIAPAMNQVSIGVCATKEAVNNGSK